MARLEHKSTFNRVADLYAVARPGYADELVDDVCAFAALQPNDPALEVGCGAGQATPKFAARRLRITALDPGDQMIRVARERLAEFSNVSFVTAPFETWDASAARFKLIFAAQSWHWIPREVAFAKASDLLDPGGVLAVFGHVPGRLEEPLGSIFERTYRKHTGKWGPPPEAGYLPSGPWVKWFDESGRFETPIHHGYAWRRAFTGSTFADFARTRSDHQMMPSEQREAILTDLKVAIAEQGDAFDWPYETHLYMARRRG
jgi:SAM-dependent methyltransferase